MPCWLQAIAFILFGTTDATAKVVSSFFGFGVILLTWLIGRLLTGRYAGFLAWLAIVLTPYFFRHARRCELGEIMAFFIALGFLFVVLAERRNPWYLVGAGIAAGLGFLAKGPPAGVGRRGGVFPGDVAGAADLVSAVHRGSGGKLCGGRDMGGAPGYLQRGCAIPALLAGPDRMATDRAQRASVAGSAIGGASFFVPVFFSYYQPWSTVGVFGAVAAVRERTKPLCLLLAWAAVVWLGFTLAGYRDDCYLLALWPAWTVGYSDGSSMALARLPGNWFSVAIFYACNFWRVEAVRMQMRSR